MKRVLLSNDPIMVKGKGDEGVLMNGMRADPLYFTSGFCKWSAFVRGFSTEEGAEVSISQDDVAMLDLLLSAGILKDVTWENEHQYVELTPPPQSTQSSSLFLLVSQTCNQRCIYCFAESGKYHRTSPAFMDEKTAKRAIDFSIERTVEGGTLNIAFFGGEPLLSWKMVKVLLDYAVRHPLAKEKNVMLTFSLSSNLTRLPEDFVTIVEEKHIGILVNIDGRRYHHNIQRPLAGGTGSYDRTVANAAYCIQAGLEIALRTTVTSQNLTDIHSIAKHHQILGGTEAIFVPVIPLTVNGVPLDPCWYPDAQEYVRMMTEIVDSGPWNRDTLLPLRDYYFRIIERQVSRLPCGAPMNHFIVVDTAGEVWPCPYLVGDARYKMGNICQTCPNNLENKLYCSVDVDSREGCRNCAWRYQCRGSCPLNALMPKGDEPEHLIKYWKKISCDVPREFLEWSLMDVCRKGFTAKTDQTTSEISSTRRWDSITG